MPDSVRLDPARVSLAKRQAERNIQSARLSERAALRERASAAKKAEVWGFYVHGDEIGDAQCEHLCEGLFRCLRPAEHDGDHL